MYKKCENCYKDGKVPNEESCKKCEDDLKRKEQECEELENDNHTLLVTRQKLLNDLWIAEESLKDFKEICDKQCEQLEAYKMEAEEGKEINAELKAENDNLKSLIWWIHVGAEGADKATTEYYENRNTPYEENYWKRIRALQPPTYESKYKLALTEIKEVAEPYQKDIDKICGNCRRYDGCHACCMDTLNNYEYRTGTTKACDKFIELKDFDINKLANQILQKISEVMPDEN